jgi:hypothetical protein
MSSQRQIRGHTLRPSYWDAWGGKAPAALGKLRKTPANSGFQNNLWNIILDFWRVCGTFRKRSEIAIPARTMIQTLDDLGETLLDEFDDIVRSANSRYRTYQTKDLIEHDIRAQAACTYCHMLADADRRFDGRPGVRAFDIRGLKIWFFEKSNAVIRFKKMDEDGRSRNYPTKQAKDFDAQKELPGLPLPPVRLTAGYLLDLTGAFVRAQIARPLGREPMWCGAIVPREDRKVGERIWIEVTRQRRF